MTDQVAGHLPIEQLTDNIVSFVNNCLEAIAVTDEPVIIEVYGDMPECRWCEQLSQDVAAGDLVSGYFKSRGQSFVLKYVEHYIDFLFNFTDGLKYKIIIHAT